MVGGGKKGRAGITDLSDTAGGATENHNRQRRRLHGVSHQKVMVHPEADCWNHGPRRTALG